MTATIIRYANGHVVTPGGTLPGAAITIGADGRIAAIAPLARDAVAGAIDLAGGWIMPGFIDTQVNGGGGVLFNDAVDVDGIAAIAAAHRGYGTTALLPTLISDTLEKVAAALDAVEAAIARGVPGIVGTHIEGPFLNPAKKGIHDPAMFRRLDDATIALLTRPRRGRVLLTLAPELCDPRDIAALAAAGVRVAAGHSDSDYDTAMAAFAAGASGVTHLYNAMTPLGHRAPGLTGAALDWGRAWCGLIADGVHVHPAALRLATRLLPADRAMLVTDAMPSVGAAQKDFTLYGRPIHVADGVCRGADGTLAGSDLDMAQAVANMVQLVGVAPQAAAAMAAANPAAFLGLSHERGALAPGLRADWVWLDAGFRARGTWIGGEQVAHGA
ncbi:N-acetylglucosamine-6-phosphate deacetylase [Sphingomonas adhaesiva]|uniref:N-acetylglucosamine-6-phosphate deacetylase n=1 Tax=Sphingomonas adhaesiva TaxID=28212 RepID=A0A2A4I602_9SPHN|nr:N-acetylglucosamine-6-phosphate deacetylase [Sphingomonas adhaesiva]PCG13548.1 N-acetylglucosamine-6-phosphate deacetylase [Sphingomonas adhaesiva]